MLRYLTMRGADRLMSLFPSVSVGSYPAIAGTLAVNVMGCLIIGVVWGLAARYEWCTHYVRLMLATGFCGGYTTFSAFAHENTSLMMAGQYGTAALYIVLSVVLGIGAVMIGMALTR